MRQIVNIPGFNGVAAGQTATVLLPVDRRYHALMLQYKTNANQATIEADITEIRIVANGKVQRRFSAADLNKILAFYGRAFVAGFITIPLSEPWRRTPDGEELLAWGTQGLSSFYVEVDVHAAAVAPTLAGFAEVDFLNRPLGAIMKWRKLTVPIAATGYYFLNTLPIDGAYAKLHLLSANIADVLVQADGITVLEATSAQNAARLARYGLTQQANTFPIAFDYTNQITDLFSMVKGNGQRIADFNVRLNMSAAAAFSTIVEVMGNPD